MLNVGGTRFETRLETLTKHSNTFFTAMIEKDMQQEDGSYFIDRDPACFAHVLHLLRNGEPSEFWSVSLCNSVALEVKYYKLPFINVTRMK